MQVMLRELKRGGIITDKIMTGKAQWKDLFAKHTFFTQDYKYYLSVISASTTKEAQNTWSGRVESRVRILVDMLGAHESIALARPFNKTFERVHKCHTEEEIEKVKEGSLDFLFKNIPAKTTHRRNESDGEVAAVKDKDANGDEKPNAGVANLKEEDVSGVKKPNGDEDFTFVYTTTSYIGLELHEGSYP
jgi:poly(A) polymerase